MKKYRLRMRVKVSLWILFVGFLTTALVQIGTIKTIKTTPIGTYECRGKLIKICNGSSDVADYLGV